MNELRVWKYQATGNDFVMTFDPDDERPLSPKRSRRSATAGSASGPTGRSGSDAGDDRPFMDYRNADGSLAEMCGTGSAASRSCSAASAREGTTFEVDTRAGVRSGRAPRRRPGPGGHGRARLHEGRDPDARARVGDVRRPADDVGGSSCPEPRCRWATRTSCCSSTTNPSGRRSPTSARCSRATAGSPRARTWSSRTWTATDRGAGVGAGRGDAGVRERRVRDRRRGARDGPRATRVPSPAASSMSTARPTGVTLTGAAARILEGTVDLGRPPGRRSVTASIAERLAARVETLVAIRPRATRWRSSTRSSAPCRGLDVGRRRRGAAGDARARPAAPWCCWPGTSTRCRSAGARPAAARAARSTVAEQPT